MAIAHIATGALSSSGEPTIVTAPSGIQAGDLMVMSSWIHTVNLGGTPSAYTATGWTERAFFRSDSASHTSHFAVLTRVANGSESGASYSLSHDESTLFLMRAAISAYRGSTPLEFVLNKITHNAAASQETIANGATMTPALKTSGTTKTNDMLVSAGMVLFSAPANFGFSCSDLTIGAASTMIDTGTIGSDAVYLFRAAVTAGVTDNSDPVNEIASFGAASDRDAFVMRLRESPPTSFDPFGTLGFFGM